MKTVKRTVVLLGMLFALTGCADPLTRFLAQYNYAPIVPATKVQHLGDVYETMDLNQQPVLLMREFPGLISDEKLARLMKDSCDIVTVPDYSGERKFDLALSANIPTALKAELMKNNVATFKIKFTGMHECMVSKAKFACDIAPVITQGIKACRTPKETAQIKQEDKFVIVGLLKADRMEYEFYTKDGTKVSITPKGDVKSIVDAQFSMDWSLGENITLTFKSPRFIGYRMGRMSFAGKAATSRRGRVGAASGTRACPPASGTGSATTAAAPGAGGEGEEDLATDIQEVPVKELLQSGAARSLEASGL